MKRSKLHQSLLEAGYSVSVVATAGESIKIKITAPFLDDSYEAELRDGDFDEALARAVQKMQSAFQPVIGRGE